MFISLCFRFSTAKNFCRAADFFSLFAICVALSVGTVPVRAQMALVSPVHNAQRLSAGPLLQVSNSAASALAVKFYGRLASTNSPSDFSMVVLPDTQYYAASSRGGLPAMWYAQTEWVITNRVSMNIAYVAHLGDIVDHGDTNGGTPITEWRNATNAMYRLENPIRTLLASGIPYGMSVGNHDQSPNGDATGTTTFFNQYFGVSHFAGKTYYSGNYSTNNDNHFDFFSAGGMDFIVLYFEYDTTANPAVIAWGNEVLRTNAHRRAIVVTHNSGSAGPTGHSAQGAAIYSALKTNANFFLMLGGHVDGEGSRIDTFNGITVRTLISNYQFRPNGGNGFMRIMTFSPTNNQVVVQTYSPYLNQYETDADSEFWFNYDMQQPAGTNSAQFQLLGTVSNVAPNALASVVWSNRQPYAAYEWYVTATDPANNTTTNSTNRFVTARPRFLKIFPQTTSVNLPINVPVTMVDLPGLASTWTLTGTSSDTNVIANSGIVVSGTNAQRTLMLTPKANALGDTTITLTASSQGWETQTSFLVRVSPAFVVQYDLNNVPVQAVDSVPPTSVAIGLSASEITRGPGVAAAGLTRGFSAQRWNNTNSTYSPSVPSRATAVSRGDYFQFSVTVASNSMASLTSLDTSMRRSADAASRNFEWQYSFDGFATSHATILPSGPVWEEIGWTETYFNFFGRTSGTTPEILDPYSWVFQDAPGMPNLTTSPGYPIPTIDLSGITSLQNLIGPQTVTFRLYGWADSNDQPADTSTVAFGRVDGPRLRGTVGIPPAINIAAISRTSTNVTITFSGAPGNAYTVRRSEMVNGSYAPIGSATVQANGIATFKDNPVPANTAFYRISQP